MDYKSLMGYGKKTTKTQNSVTDILKEEFGDMVNVLRTENFSNGIGYYAERWKSAQKS